MQGSYLKFIAMVLTSVVAMFVMTYLNTWELGHIFWSESRAYMVLYMGAGMALIMLAFMRNMYTSYAYNMVLVAGAITVFAVSLFLVRSQTTIGDVSYMRAMIPHHSIAILTSTRAHLVDPRVRKLAAAIAETQKREIAEMKALILDLTRKN